MVLIGKVNERTSDSEPQNSSRFAGTNLTGWAGIETYVMKHDSTTMKDYADDIDTLLVFAALFSAILTTFVVQTYQLLQPGSNDTTNQLIAYQIFSQGTHANIPPTINATISTLLTTSSFTPSSSARWINGLFFFSLVISLIAALFSIMAKQWIREYLKWNAPLADPRENVLLRQIRFDCWEVWNVDTFIWSIPVLQELAMVLFLIGVVVLVWTLDSAVAISVTILVALFLATILAITVLPIFVKRCPYKSPTAWAFVRLADAVRYIAQFPCRWVRYYSSYILYNLLRISGRIFRVLPFYIPKPWLLPHDRFPQEKTWRTDDLYYTTKELHALFKVADLQLEREATHIGKDGTLIPEPNVHSASYVHGFLDDLRVSPVLIRALEWVSRASPGDPQSRVWIDQCMNSVHPPNFIAPPSQAIALTHLYVFGALMFGNRERVQSQPRLDVVSTVAGGLHAHIQTRLDEISRHRISLGVIAQTTSDNMREITFALDSSFSLHQHQCADPQGLLLRLLATDLRTITTGYPGSPLHWTRNNSLLRRVFEWLSMMTTYSCDNILLRLRDPYLDGIRSILINEPIQQMLLSSKAPGLRTLAFILACEHARICIDDDSSLVLYVGSTELLDYEAILLNYSDRDTLQWLEDDLNIVVFTGWQWLVDVDVTSSPLSGDSDKNTRIIKTIQNALEESLACNTNPFRFLSCHVLRAFAESMACSAELDTSWFYTGHSSVFAGFLHVVAKCYRKGIYPDDMEYYYEILKDTVGSDNHCSENNHPRTSHSCNNFDQLDAHEHAPEIGPSLAKQEITGPSLPASEPPSSVDGEVAVHRPFLDRIKLFGLQRPRLTKATDEESRGSQGDVDGEVQRATWPGMSTGVASEDVVPDSITTDCLCAISPAFVAGEDVEDTRTEASGTSLFPRAAGRPPAVDDQYGVVADAGSSGGERYAVRSPLYVTTVADDVMVEVERTRAEEPPTRGNPNFSVDPAQRSGSLNRNFEHTYQQSSTISPPFSFIVPSLHYEDPSGHIRSASQDGIRFSTVASMQYDSGVTDELAGTTADASADLGDESPHTPTASNIDLNDLNQPTEAHGDSNESDAEHFPNEPRVLTSGNSNATIFDVTSQRPYMNISLAAGFPM